MAGSLSNREIEGKMYIFHFGQCLTENPCALFHISILLELFSNDFRIEGAQNVNYTIFHHHLFLSARKCKFVREHTLMKTIEKKELRSRTGYESLEIENYPAIIEIKENRNKTILIHKTKNY